MELEHARHSVVHSTAGPDPVRDASLRVQSVVEIPVARESFDIYALAPQKRDVHISNGHKDGLVCPNTSGL
eukprot:2612357-Rhodomonas_salina.1